MLWTKPGVSFQPSIQGHILVFILFRLFAKSLKELRPKELLRKRLRPWQTILQTSVGFQLAPGWLSVARHAGPLVCPSACGGTKGCCHRYGNKWLVQSIGCNLKAVSCKDSEFPSTCSIS